MIITVPRITASDIRIMPQSGIPLVKGEAEVAPKVVFELVEFCCSVEVPLVGCWLVPLEDTTVVAVVCG